MNIRVRGHGESVRVLWMPLDRMQELEVIVWDDANQDFTPEKSECRSQSLGFKNKHLRNIIRNYFREFPDDEATV